jgi:hypothetical protein
MNIYTVTDGVFNGEYPACNEEHAEKLFTKEFYGFKPKYIKIRVRLILTNPVEVVL